MSKFDTLSDLNACSYSVSLATGFYIKTAGINFVAQAH